MTAPLAAGVARLGLGCSRLGSTLGGVTGAAAQHLIHHALASGIRLFDTADIYGQGDSERLIGLALSGRREGVLLVTKAGQRFTPGQQLMGLVKAPLRQVAARLPALHGAIARGRAGTLPRDYSPAHLSRSITSSLGRLRTERIDLFLLHSPNAATLARGEAFAMLNEAVRAGRIGGWGASCDEADAVAAALRIPQLAALQLPVALLATCRPALEAAAARGVTILLREILAGAATPAARGAALQEALGLPVAIALIGTRSPAHLDEMIGFAQPHPSPASDVAV